MSVTTLTTIPWTNYEIMFGGNKVKANLTIDIVTSGWSFKINRLQWIDNGILYTLIGPCDVETLVKVAESITDRQASSPEVVEPPAVKVELPAVL